MIKKLRQKFVLIAMSSLVLVLVIILGAINGVNFYRINQEADSLLEILADNEGHFPEFEKEKPPKDNRSFSLKMTEETRFETRYFLVWTNPSNTVTQINTGHIAAVSSSDAQEFADRVLAEGKTSGYLEHYKYLVREKDYGRLVVFLDCHSNLDTMFSFLLLSLGIGTLCVLVVFLLVSVLSQRAIKPIVESIEKQKQFITDAGHEIKTPLSIIAANADVLELTGGTNEWVDSIRNQTMRMNSLVQELLTLTKMEEEQRVFQFSTFSLSQDVRDAAESFYILAQSAHIALTTQIQEDIIIYGERESIRKLLSILLDNAVKYAGEGGWIRIQLRMEGKVAYFAITNSYEDLESLDFSKLFDRFYRSDQSRSRMTGGYGIGLSIAKAIAEGHKAKIQVRREQEDGICFSVAFPLKEKKMEPEVERDQ
ncbi:MAG: HAMP domain-containing sensor histidine kinase [Oscillospiraceae bacterium]|nr:HAMP domain-containing sensor histidine kinase [Oscillospiraceae bacterium]